jgi:lipoyl(octanoyl) transferase
MPTIETIRLPGLTPYADMLAMQHARREAVSKGEAPNTLSLLEHPPVFTCGRDFHATNLLHSKDHLATLGIAVEPTDRGGDITYHGPGQLVAYPILDLNQWRCSVGWYLRTLEQVLINLLTEYGLQGERIEGLTGVWVGGAKVAAIGVGLHRWVTCHGIALNITLNLDHFRLIIPCGIPDKPVTSLEKLLPAPPPFEQAAARFEHHFRESFDSAPY